MRRIHTLCSSVKRIENAVYASVVYAVGCHVVKLVLLVSEGHILRCYSVHFAKYVFASKLSCGRGTLYGCCSYCGTVGVFVLRLDFAASPVHCTAKKVYAGNVKVFVVRHCGTGSCNLKLQGILKHKMSACKKTVFIAPCAKHFEIALFKQILKQLSVVVSYRTVAVLVKI